LNGLTTASIFFMALSASDLSAALADSGLTADFGDSFSIVILNG
jgi:hypothetical protein